MGWSASSGAEQEAPGALRSELEGLQTLLGARRRFPDLLRTRTDYDFDLFKLLEEQGRLQEQLVRNPGYGEAMARRSERLLDFTFTPATDNAPRIVMKQNPEALERWRARLLRTLEPFQNVPDWERGKRLLEAIASPATSPQDRARLLELQLVLQERDGMVRGRIEDARAWLGRLGEDSLAYYLDIADVWVPKFAALNRKLESYRLPSAPEQALHEAEKALQSIADDRIQVQERLSGPLHVTEVPPALSIFRGCAGGDCSTKYSFGYPNDPNERVFYILDSSGRLKGYINGTKVRSEGAPAFYLNTIAGPDLSQTEAELLIRGLQAEAPAFGVERLVLPTAEKRKGLLNYLPIRRAFQAASRDDSRVPIEYQGREVRRQLEDFVSVMNQGDYDKMATNSEGVRLAYPPEGDPSFRFEIRSKVVKSAWKPVARVSRDEVLALAADVLESGREDQLERILALRKLSRRDLDQFLLTRRCSVRFAEL